MKYKITLNNRIYEVVVEQGEAILEKEYEAVAPQAAPQPQAVPQAAVQTAPQAAPVATGDGEAFPSPLPGTVIAVKCEAGKSYKAGSVLFIVESMKMENEVTLGKDATITSISVSKGQSVQSGTTLCIIK